MLSAIIWIILELWNYILMASDVFGAVSENHGFFLRLGGSDRGNGNWKLTTDCRLRKKK
jgi:hypothetical protein